MSLTNRYCLSPTGFVPPAIESTELSSHSLTRPLLSALSISPNVSLSTTGFVPAAVESTAGAPQHQQAVRRMGLRQHPGTRARTRTGARTRTRGSRGRANQPKPDLPHLSPPCQPSVQPSGSFLGYIQRKWSRGGSAARTRARARPSPHQVFFPPGPSPSLGAVAAGPVCHDREYECKCPSPTVCRWCSDGGGYRVRGSFVAPSGGEEEEDDTHTLTLSHT